MLKSTIVTLRLLVGLMQHNLVVQSIIVERNLNSYYRLPTTSLRGSKNNSEEYFLLQCPFKSSLNIPQPLDMPICQIVGKYNTANDTDPPKDEIKMTPATLLHTKLNYEQPVKKERKTVKWIKVKRLKPYKILVQPPRNERIIYRRPNKIVNHKLRPESSNIPFLQENPKSQATSYSSPLKAKTPDYAHDLTAVSSSVKPKVMQDLPNQDIDFIDDSAETFREVRDYASPLKYVGVKNVLNKLQLKVQPSSFNNTEETFNKSEKFFTESKDFKKGFRTKGYQNMYHRDEIYQDHIFYDDIQQRGNYNVYKKSKEKL